MLSKYVYMDLNPSTAACLCVYASFHRWVVSTSTTFVGYVE